MLAINLLIDGYNSESEIELLTKKASAFTASCLSINQKLCFCRSKLGQVYARAAYRAYLTGWDPQTWLQRAGENLTVAQKQNAGLDAEQGAALAHIVEASVLVQGKQDARPALLAVKEDLARCFRMAPNDATCRAHAVEAE